MPRNGQRIVELAFPRLRRNHLHRRRTQPGGKRIPGLLLALKLDHAEQPITKSGIAFRDELRELLLAAMTPDPAVQPVGSEAAEQRNATKQDDKPRPNGCLPNAIKTVDQKER